MVPKYVCEAVPKDVTCMNYAAYELKALLLSSTTRFYTSLIFPPNFTYFIASLLFSGKFNMPRPSCFRQTLLRIIFILGVVSYLMAW